MKTTQSKSTWSKFIVDAKQGLEYLGSTGKLSLEDMFKRIDEKIDTSLSPEITRTLISGSSALKFKTERDTYSYLDKKGKVYFYNGCYIIHKEKDNNLIMYYKGV